MINSSPGDTAPTFTADQSKRLAWILGLLLTCLGSLPLHSQAYPFRCASIADGLAQSVVNVLLEDSRGFLWIGTASGLSRFDGQVFVNYDTAHGLPSPRIYSLLEDASGRLWAGTDRGVAYLEDESWRTAFAQSPIARLRILSLAESSSPQHPGQLIIGSRGGGLFVGRQDKLQPLELPSPSIGSVFALQWAGGHLWAGTDGGLWRLTEGDKDWTASRFEAPWAQQATTALAVDDDGLLLVSNASGTFAVEPSSDTWHRLIEGSVGQPTALTVGRRGEVWLGTHHQGLVLIEEGNRRRFTTLNGLPTEGIRALLQGSDGGLWVGTYGSGICRLNDLAFSLFGKQHGLPSEQVLGLAEGPDGDLWVGMLEGGVARFDGQSFKSFDQQDGLRSLAVSHLRLDDSGTLWVATLRGGLHRLSSGKHRFEPVDLPQAPQASIFHLTLDGEQGLWIATWGHGLARLDLRHRTFDTVREGLLSQQIFSTSVDADGKLWIAMPNGVQILDPDDLRLTSFSSEQQPPLGRVRSIVHHGGRAFLATDGGLAMWTGERFEVIARPQGLASNDLYLATLDSRHQLWVGSERGLDRLRFDDAGSLEEIRHFGVSEGFVGLETNQNAVLEDSRGRLWLGTHGLARFEAAEEPPPPSPPSVEIIGLRLLDDTRIPLTPEAPIRLAWHQDNLVFELLAIDFIAPEEVRYRYRLLGHGAGWSPPSASRLAVFPQLEPGSYSFEVAAARRGAWGPSRRLDLVISPPWWATWWFRVAAFGGLAALGVLALWRRTAEQRRRRRQLEKAVEERTHELVVAKQAAEAANAAKSDFLSNMSHELRTPLTGVVSAAELIGKQGLDSRQQHLVETIQTSGRALLSVVNDILDQAKIEASGLQMDSRPFSPRLCLEECVEMVRHSAALKGLELNSSVGADLPPLLVGDPVRFRQVLINLLGNAIKFTDQGSISAAMFVGSDDGDHCRLVVEVRDTGIGIPQDVQQRIFQPFEQVDASASRSFGGTGLGLSICDRLVTLMGGSIEVESTLGQGSLFRVDVAFAWPGEKTVAENPTSQALPAIRPGLRILVAEDNPVSQLITASQLEALGIHPQLADDGAEAVRWIRTMRPDLVFMDGQMPVMDGYAATQEVRAEEADGEHTIIVGFTAHATADARARCLAVGMDDYLAKPVSLESLARCLCRWFPAPAG